MNRPVYELLKKLALLENSLDLIRERQFMTVQQEKELQTYVQECKMYIQSIWGVTQEDALSSMPQAVPTFFVAHLSMEQLDSMLKKYGKLIMRIPPGVAHQACCTDDTFILGYSCGEIAGVFHEDYIVILYAGSDDEQYFVSPTLEMVLLTALFENAQIDLTVESILQQTIYRLEEGTDHGC